MATSSYANLFGTTGAGQQGSQAGISTMFGQQATARQDDEEQRRRQQQQQAGQTQTFAQMQAAGQARPAPQAQVQQAPMMERLQSQMQSMAPQAQVQQAPMMERLQSQMQSMAPQTQAPAPTQPPAPAGPSLQQQAFQQMRQSSQADLQAQFQAQQQQLNEEMARRGLSSSSIGAGRMGDLAGQQARALSNLDAQLLQQQAQQDFEAQQAREARQFTGQESALERALRTQMQQAGFGQESEQARLQREFAGGESALERALRERLQTQKIGESAADRALRERLGLAELTGTLGGQETMASRQFGFQQQLANQQLAMELARIFSASDNPQAATQLAPILQQLLSRLPGYQAPAATPTSGGASAGAAGTGSATTSAPSLDQLLATLGGSNYDPYAGMPFEGAL